MRTRLLLLVLAALIAGANAACAITFTDLVVGSATGIAPDGSAIAYTSGGHTYILTEAGATIDVGPTDSSFGITKWQGRYAVGYTLRRTDGTGYHDTYAWVEDAPGAGIGTSYIDTGDHATTWFQGRAIAADSNQVLIAGQLMQYSPSAVTTAARWKAPTGSLANYDRPVGFWNSLYYFYGASNIGTYCGWGRLSASGGVANKSQAMVLEGTSLVSLRNGWGPPSTTYFSNARALSLDGSTCVGDTGLSDNSTSQACYWDRDGGYTTNTTCNLIPLLPGYAKSYGMKADGDGSLLAGWTIKPSGQWGIDRRTIWLYHKITGRLVDLRQELIAGGVDMSGWGLMDIMGISADGTKLTGTMLPASDTYWTTGSVTGPYHTWVVEISPYYDSVVEAKALGDGKQAFLAGAVTYSDPWSFYLESLDRSAGIMVVHNGGATVGTLVSVNGMTLTNGDGERFIEATDVSAPSEGSVAPLGMPIRSVGGGDWRHDPSTGAGQKGVEGGVGVNNIGLLVRVCGRASYVDSNHFTIDDGSGRQLECETTDYVSPSLGFVSVTGVVSCRLADFAEMTLKPVLLVRSFEPITTAP